MKWFKKANNDIVVQILEKYKNGEFLSEAIAELQKITNVCDFLSQICNGQLVPPFYMTVWSTMCGTSQPQPSENNEEQSLPDPNLNAEEF